MENLEVALRRCAAIASSSDRLACFDSLALASDDPAETLTSSLEADASQDESTHSVTDPSPVEAGADRLGAEQLDDQAGRQDLSSRIAGSFEGWDGDTVFRLENGQVWQQTDSSYQYAQAESPRVTIRRAAFGSYLMQVEGIGRAVRVRRLE